jgi:hypothetical protein
MPGVLNGPRLASSASLWTGTRVPRNTGFPPMIRWRAEGISELFGV